MTVKLQNSKDFQIHNFTLPQRGSLEIAGNWKTSEDRSWARGYD